MYTVALVNLPFAAVSIPSLALTQLKTMTERVCGPEVATRVIYANHDFASFFGLEMYEQISGSLEANMAGLGEWIFRDLAFPEAAANDDAYFRRFFRAPDGYIARHRQEVDDLRRRLPSLVDDLIDRYELDRADLVGFTSMFCQNVAAFAVARAIKGRNARVLTAVGGANCESPMGQAIARHVDAIDFVFSGPSLRSFPEFVGLTRRGEVDRCHALAGVFTKRNTTTTRDLMSGTHRATATVSPIGPEQSIDEYVPLDYLPFLESLDATFGRERVRPRLTFETSRGCWWGEKAHCTFCGLNGQTMKYRAMAPAVALEQFEHLFRYSPWRPTFQAVDNIMPREFLTDVFPYVTPPGETSIFYEVKADLTRSELEILSRARVLEVQPGIEALATSTLKLMKKGTSATQNLMFLKNCLELGIAPDWNLLVGFPGESEEVFEQYCRDLPRMTHLPPPSGVFPVRFDRFSPYFVNSEQYQLKLRPNDWYSYVYPFDETVLQQLAYFFVNQDFDASYFVALARNVKRLEQVVGNWLRRWRSGDARPELILVSESGRATVRDTRGDAPRTHVLSDDCVRALRILSRPGRAGDVSRELGTNSEAALAWLGERGLTFQEGERYLSLVTIETNWLDAPAAPERTVVSI